MNTKEVSCDYIEGIVRYVDTSSDIFTCISIINEDKDTDNLDEIISTLEKKILILKKLTEKYRMDFYLNDFNEVLSEEKLFEFIDSVWESREIIKNKKEEFKSFGYPNILENLGLLVFNSIVCLYNIIENKYSSMTLPLDYNVFADDGFIESVDVIQDYFNSKIKSVV